MQRWTRPQAPVIASFRHRTARFAEAMQSHQDHEINVALAGEAVYHLDGGTSLTFSGGEILLLPAGVRHALEVPRRHAMAILHVHPEVFRTLPGLPAGQLADLRQWERPLPARIARVPAAFASIEHLAREIVAEQAGRAAAADAMLLSLAQQAAVHVLRLLQAADIPGAVDDASRRVLAVQEWMDRHFTQTCSLEELAARCRLTPTYFAARFRQLAGVPPMTYLRRRRLEHAILLLQRTPQPVQDIALSVGFENPNHFHHAFRKQCGMTPLACRRRAPRDPRKP